MPAELVVVKGKDRGVFVTLAKDGSVVIGRAEGSELRLRGDKKVSTSHARITTQGDRHLLEDLGSTNGTYVNDERIHTAPLRSGDRVKIGHTLLVFRTDTSSVHLSDLDVNDTGHGNDSKDKLSTAVPAHRASNQGSRSGLSTTTRRRIASDEALAQGVLDLTDALVPAGDLKVRIDAALRVVLSATGAARAVLFLRDVDAGALGCASAIGREDEKENAPVDGDALRRAMAGELGEPSGVLQASAAPIRAGEAILGALYVDSPGGRTPNAKEGRFLASAAAALAQAVRIDRLERLVATSVEVVSLAQTPPTRAVLDARALVEATARLYAPVAGARGLSFEIVPGETLPVVGDELLLSRALDRLVEAALVSAKGGLRLTVERGAAGVRIVLGRGGQPLSEALARDLVAPEGPVADLKTALGRTSDGAIAFARAAIARSGGRLSIEAGLAPMVVAYVIDLPLGSVG